MSTSYYFVKKASIQEADQHNQAVASILAQAKTALEKLDIESSSLSTAFRHPMWDQMQKTYESIHIGKRSNGWKPLFQTSPDYASMKEMKKWYEANQSLYVIQDDYDNVLTWAQLEQELITWDGKKSQVAYMREHFPNRQKDYTVDVEGYEWSSAEFS